MLEAICHADKSFIGLSYSELFMPALDPSVGRLPGNLKPKHMQDWLKRIRAAVYPRKLRFFGVGEYGDKSWRPHYHVILFGYPTCVRGRTLRLPGSSRPLAFMCCENCRLVQESWPYGDVDLGSVTHHSASYCAAYTVKKMTAVDDKRLVFQGSYRSPEFCRMSLRPGIGVDGLWDVASSMMQFGLDETMPDVPSGIAYGKQVRPLGRYLRGKLREMVGRDAKAPQSTLDAMAEELRPLRESAFINSSSFKKAIMEYYNGEYALWEAKGLIYGKDRKL